MESASAERKDEKNMANTLGNRICALRKKMGLTQDQLAEAMGVSAQAVSKWENDLSCPDITMLPQLADFFHVTIDELMREEKVITAPQVVPEAVRKPFEQLLLKIWVNAPSKEISGGFDKVKVNLPMTMVKLGLEMGLMSQMTGDNDALKDIDFAALLQLAEKGVIGKLVEVETADGTVVEITIE